jgi:hypothetical protein
VKTDGARMEYFVPGLDADLRRVAASPYIEGPTCCAREAIAKTNEPSVAYKYVAG